MAKSAETKTKKTTTKPKLDKPVKPKKASKPKRKSAIEANNHLVITETTDPNSHWYVVHTYSGHEAKVAAQLLQRVQSMGLESKIHEVLIPTQDKIHIKQGKKTTVKEQLYPGYMLIKMFLTDDAWLCVRTTQGVTSFIGIGNNPTPLLPQEVAGIQRFIKQAAPKFKTSFNLGEAVKIIDGPFTDFLGQIDALDESRGKATVLVSIFGRETPVELDFLQIAKV